MSVDVTHRAALGQHPHHRGEPHARLIPRARPGPRGILARLDLTGQLERVARRTSRRASPCCGESIATLKRHWPGRLAVSRTTSTWSGKDANTSRGTSVAPIV